MLLETDYSSEAFKENINILLLLTGSFPPKPLKTTAHSLPKISRNLSSNGPIFGKKYKKGFLFSNIGIKQGKMGTETSKIALNAHVHLRTANQQMSRPERHVDDITDMRRSCRLRENTSGRRPLGSSSRLLKVPNTNIVDNFVRRGNSEAEKGRNNTRLVRSDDVLIVSWNLEQVDRIKHFADYVD